MKKVEKLISLCLAALIFVLNISAAAAADSFDIDLDRHGSVTLYISDLETDEPITSGDFEIYMVAALVDNNGSYEFSLTGDFSGGSFDLSNTESARFANSLAGYVSINRPACYASVRLSDGVLKLDGLPAGLYLVINSVAAAGYYSLNPFVFSIPDIVDGEVVYDIVGEPKPEPIKPIIPPPLFPPPPSTVTLPPDDPYTPESPEEGGDEGEEDGGDEPDGPDEPDDVEIEDTPETGDKEMPLIWVGGLVLSALAAAAAIILYKNHKD